MEYINKYKLLKELEKCKKICEDFKVLHTDIISQCIANAKINVFQQLIEFINTLETKEVNLDKELKTLDDTLFDLDGVAVQGATNYLTVNDVKDVAKHFYELGLASKR